MRLVLLEPERPGSAWLPFAGARPLAELRAGAWRIRERWASLLRADDVITMGDHCAGFVDVDAAPHLPRGSVAGPALVARSDFAPAGAPTRSGALPPRLLHGDVTVAWAVSAGQVWTGPHDEGEAGPVEGHLLAGAWDLVTALERLLLPDCVACLGERGGAAPDGCLVLGDPGDLMCRGATVEPGVVFDLRQGPVVLGNGVQVRSGTRLEGPLFVGAGSVLLGGAIRHSAIGPICRVHGEVASSVLLGYANKSHDGFLGHSVLGHWVNLGAGTITSNLKNTYGEIRLDLPGARVETGRTNLGTLFGDHAKTAIGTLLSTGTVVGPAANVVGAPVPRWVPPFAWGASGAERCGVEGFLATARRVLPRRNVQVTEAVEQSLRALHARLSA